jgi:hypothetical protein
MTGIVKGLIVSVVVIVLLIAAGVTVGIYWLSSHSGEYLEKSKQSMIDGQRFGRGTDNHGCVTESISLYKENPGFSKAITTELFLQGCLHSSKETPGFCDDVPRPTEFMKSAQWQLKQCALNDLHDSYCGQLFAQVQTFCSSRRGRE